MLSASLYPSSLIPISDASGSVAEVMSPARDCGWWIPTEMFSRLLAICGMAFSDSLHAVNVVHAEINNRGSNPFAIKWTGLFLPPPLRNVYKMCSF